MKVALSLRENGAEIWKQSADKLNSELTRPLLGVAAILGGDRLGIFVLVMRPLLILVFPRAGVVE